jgi:tetratricopeptide (TPR) repeat protein
MAGHPEVGAAGPVTGTPAYMPPEQWRGADAVVPASDLYAFGILLFELFAGVAGTPHPVPVLPLGVGHAVRRAAWQAAWYAAHQRGPARWLADPAVGARAAGPLAGLPPAAAAGALAALDTLVRACLAATPGDRPTAEQARAALGALAEGLGLARVPVPAAMDPTPALEAAFWHDLASTYGHVGQHEQELRLARRARDLEPDEPRHWLLVGVALGALGRQEAALAAYAETETRLTPAWRATAAPAAEVATLPVALADTQGSALGALGRYAEAVAAYERALAIDSTRAQTWQHLAAAYGRWARVAGAGAAARVERLRAADEAIGRGLARAPALAGARDLRRVIRADLRDAEQAQIGDHQDAEL